MTYFLQDKKGLDFLDIQYSMSINIHFLHLTAWHIRPWNFRLLSNASIGWRIFVPNFVV